MILGRHLSDKILGWIHSDNDQMWQASFSSNKLMTWQALIYVRNTQHNEDQAYSTLKLYLIPVLPHPKVLVDGRVTQSCVFVGGGSRWIHWKRGWAPLTLCCELMGIISPWLALNLWLLMKLAGLKHKIYTEQLPTTYQPALYNYLPPLYSTQEWYIKHVNVTSPGNYCVKGRMVGSIRFRSLLLFHGSAIRILLGNKKKSQSDATLGMEIVSLSGLMIQVNILPEGGPAKQVIQEHKQFWTHVILTSAKNTG